MNHRSADPVIMDLAGSELHAEQAAEYFDETDGAYAVTEPDPFADHSTRRISRVRPSLRAEILSSLPDFPAHRTKPATPARSTPPSLAVLDELSPVLPDGLHRGSTIAVTSSVSLLLTVLGAPTAAGAWVAMVGMPAISADAAVEAGIDLARLAIISSPDGGWTGSSWTTAVGALLDAVDIVVCRPGAVGGSTLPAGVASRWRISAGAALGGRIGDGDARRLTARARTKDAVLVLFGNQALSWPSIELQLSAQHGQWRGISDGHGRITSRQLVVSATGRGRSARPRTAEIWLPIAKPGAGVAAQSSSDNSSGNGSGSVPTLSKAG